MFDLSKAEGDDETLAAIAADVDKLREQIEALEFRRMFNDPADPGNCFVDIQAGAGGTEAMDWAQMLLRQYLKYCERKGFTAEVLEETPGDVAGIRSATLKIEGDHAYGHLRSETGVHRLVRKSPFDSAGGRHTSFASLFVYPEVDDTIEIEINPADVRVDTFRASGAGGQHINKTDSAVRLTHLPTGIVVQCQNSRSQHSNRDEAWRVLRSRLYEHEMRKQREAQQKLEDSKTDVGWGHQIRSCPGHGTSRPCAPPDDGRPPRRQPSEGDPRCVKDPPPPCGARITRRPRSGSDAPSSCSTSTPRRRSCRAGCTSSATPHARASRCACTATA